MDALNDVEDETILKCFKTEFEVILKNEGNSENYLENLFNWITIRRLSGNLEIVHLPFLAQALISCLTFKNLSDSAENLMEKLQEK